MIDEMATGLGDLGYRIGRDVVAGLLCGPGYSPRANRKTREGTKHPDRDVRFHYINEQVGRALAAGRPAISVDTKKIGTGQRRRGTLLVN